MSGIKVVVLGAHGVGKSSIVKRVAGNIRPKRKIGRDIYKMQYPIGKGRSRTLEIVDSCPSFLSKLFKSDVRHQIQEGDAFIVVYALDDVKSYCDAMDTCMTVYREKGTMDVPLVLVGNKTDLPCKVEAFRLSQLGDLPRLMMSAKKGTSVKRAFDMLLYLVLAEERRESKEREAMARVNETWAERKWSVQVKTDVDRK